MILNDFFWRLKIYFVIELINGKKNKKYLNKNFVCRIL